jgi:sacsin
VVSTGRFGLGFNATYHCTDLPSFVSNESLVIFDPHTKYLPGAEKHAPGQAHK